MRKFLGTLVILFALLVMVGYVRGWFSISRESQDQELHLQLKIDRMKIRKDTRNAKEAAREIHDNIERRLDEEPEEGL